MLTIAFKEWAAVCRALADGTQSVLLRKGGIAERDGVFRPEHDRFWLYPTHFHEQQRTGLKPEATPLLDAAEADRPPAGRLRLTHFAEVSAAAFVHDLAAALALDPFHVWSADTVRQRFHYRSHGLYVLPVRVFRARTAVELPDHPGYAGCKTWVELSPGAEEQPADPVLADAEWADLLNRLDALLGRQG